MTLAFVALWAIGSVKEYLEQASLALDMPAQMRLTRIFMWPIVTLFWLAVIVWDWAVVVEKR